VSNSTITELFTSQNLGTTYIQATFNVKEIISVENRKKGYLVRFNDNNYEQEDSIVKYIQRSDIVMILQNVKSTTLDWLNFLKDNLRKNSCLITSGNFDSYDIEDYEKKMEKYFKLIKKEDISVNISHGMG